MNKKIELFIPCFIDQLYPETAFNTIRLLERAGCEVIYNPMQTCCGKLAYTDGHWDQAKEIGTKFLEDFTGKNNIVTPAASCASMIKLGFKDLFSNQDTLYSQYKDIQKSTFELSDFLVNYLKFENFGAELIGTAVYHDSCTALRDCKIKEEPRKLLSYVGGLEILEMPHQDTCCGFGDSFSVKFKGLSSAMAEQKVRAAQEVNADYIISTDSTCLMQLQAYIDRHSLPIRTIHLVDVLASGWANI